MSNYQNQDETRHSLDEIEEAEQEEIRSEQQKKKKFNLFDRWNREREDAEYETPICDEPTLSNFFKLIGRKISQLFSVNLLIVVGNFPIFFILLGISGYLSIHTVQPVYAMFAPLKGAMMFGNSSATAALWTVFSHQTEVTVLTTWDYIVFGIGALVILTFGPVRVGVTYILRNIFRGEPVFMIHDFFYAIKRNIRQSIIIGIVDLGVIALIIYDIVFFNINYNVSFMMSTMFFMSIAFAFIWFFMRPYIYLQLITFDIGIFKMIKNSFLFTMIGIKRNFMALLGTVALIAIEYFLLRVYIPLAMIVPFVILPSLLIIIGIYAAYPKIKEIMIDPYYSKANETQAEE